MGVVAVAGGTGGVGKTVVEQLLLDDSHKVFVLGRKAQASRSAKEADFLQVDYANIDALARILEDHNIDTVISTINLENDAGSQSQLGLIAAAEKSQATRRFIPSEFLTPMDEEDPKAGAGFGGWVPNARALKKTNLEYIRISIGFFSDYWGMPRVKSNLKPFHWFLNMERGLAVIPGSGDDVFTVTYSEDLGRAIVALVNSEERWPKEGILRGDTISVNKLVSIAEKIRGSKLDVIYDSVEDLKKGNATLVHAPNAEPENEAKANLAMVVQMIMAGACLLPQDDRDLRKRFPDLHLTTVEGLLEAAWGS
nr:nmrA-like family protein [Colletotrichum truncatum]KAF6800694.1 nmrA-like family protein [Colletotrichum truncatum]